MTPEQEMVFSALARGRLIFPFRAELKELRAQSKAGPLIGGEAERLADLEAGFKEIIIKDKWFHSAMEGGDTKTARKYAEEAKEICADLAG